MSIQRNTVLWLYFGLFVLALAGALLTFKVRYSVCQVCGLQRYERSIYGITLRAASSAHVDPDGRAAQWEQAQGHPCEHVWVTQVHTLFGPRPPEPVAVPSAMLRPVPARSTEPAAP